ncbi:hypothetical protein [Mycobacterium sp. 94-17]|uniref:hypothetical protein n=1 Tax=Mycobacterium sp. 94-17 TaxID=2986147 RepID=UPI002D1F87C3|nr:hypothetical protein [Mycobacterium sp. 94-17]MEB4208851.1 hypothetical protein [Mycobacterium sp. 94-17]
MGLFGYLAVFAGVAELVLAAFVFAYVKRLLSRPTTPTSEEVGGSRRALSKLRKGEPMSAEELDCAVQTITERSSLMAFSIPAAVFTIGCFIVFSTLELHGIRSLRIYIGLFPMLGSINLTIQLLRVVALKRRLREVGVPTSSRI